MEVGSYKAASPQRGVEPDPSRAGGPRWVNRGGVARSHRKVGHLTPQVPGVAPRSERDLKTSNQHPGCCGTQGKDQRGACVPNPRKGYAGGEVAPRSLLGGRGRPNGRKGPFLNIQFSTIKILSYYFLVVRLICSKLSPIQT